MKSRLAILQLCGLFLLCANLHGQYKIDHEIKNNPCLLTGNLLCDLTADMDGIAGKDSTDIKGNIVYKRFYSPLRAGLFSLALPGAGQFYTKNYLKGSLFLGGEVLLWVIYLTYEMKGDNQSDDFQKYANENWSVVRYAEWINTNFNKSIAINTAENILSPWERVNWDELNAVEDAISADLTIYPTGFTHKLAPYGDQQYYEMIGKYSQFGSGWADAGGFTKADILANGGIGNVSPQFLAYAKMRGDANDFYNIATTASYVIIANHVLSALEAIWNASRLNHKVKLETHIEPRKIYRNIVEFVPTLHVKYEL